MKKLGFNAWGQRRNEASLTDYPINSVIALLNQEIEITNKGFTGHEHLDGVGLIHMNGRIYDPTLGRFLQADPHIQDPSSSQSLNRYSYVLNNPLTMTDPSGYFSLSKFFKKWIRPLAAIAISIWLPGAAFWANSGGLFATMVSGTISGAISSGSLKGALIGGLTAGAFKGVGDKFAKVAGDKGTGIFGTGLNGGQFAGKVAMHGLVGGASSVLQGGKFGHGFVSAGVTEAFSGQIEANITGTGKQVATAAILGGSVSALTGGKFANGAITGAFSFAFGSIATKNSNTINADSSYPDTPEGRQAQFNKIVDMRKSLGIEVGEGYEIRYVDLYAKIISSKFGDTLVTCENACQVNNPETEGLVGGTTEGKTITLYRGAFTSGFIQVSYLKFPDSPNSTFLSGLNMSSIETGAWVLGHEAAHSIGVDQSAGFFYHQNAEYHGYKAYRAYRELQK
jgi:RHS repeat-associated protein